MSTRHFINDIEIRPVNADAISFKIDFTQDYNLPEISTDSILLANKGKQLVLDHIENLGVYEGIPYTVKIWDEITLEYYISLIESPKISGGGDAPIDVKIKRRKSVMSFMSRAKGLSFENINSTNPITTVNHKYSIIKEDQGVQLILFTITVFLLTKELIEGIRGITEKSSETVEAAIPDTVVVVPSAGVAIKIPTIILAAIKLALQIAYFVLILVQIIIIIKKILEILVPPVKKMKVTRVKHLLEVGCAKLNYGFKSDFLDNLPGMTIAPVPLLNPNPSVWEKFSPTDSTIYSKGYPSASDSVSTLKDLIDAVVLMCNGTVRVEDGNVLRIDPNLDSVPSTAIKNTLNIQSNRTNEWTYNTGETWKRYLLRYQWDATDTHTFDNYQKGQIELSTEPVDVVNEDLVEIEGLVTQELPFALGARKSKLNITEDALYKLAKVADEVISFFGGAANMASKIQGRVGVMQISQQQYSTTKLLYAVGEKQPANFMDIIGAPALYENHKSNQVKENFKRIYTSEIPLSDSKFKSIVDGGNFVTDSETDEELEILTINWVDNSRIATINYGVHSTEGDNTETKTIFQ